jgi:hypothetical protein
VRCTVGRPVRTSLIISVPAGEIREAHSKSCLGGVRHYLTTRRRELIVALGFAGLLGRGRFIGGALPSKATRLPYRACQAREFLSARQPPTAPELLWKIGGGRIFRGGGKGGSPLSHMGNFRGGATRSRRSCAFRQTPVTCLWRRRTLSVGADLNPRGSGSESTRGVRTSCLVARAGPRLTISDERAAG